MTLDVLLREYRPGSGADDWTWDDEERALLSHPCPSATARAHGIEAECPYGNFCPGAGCYQQALEAFLRSVGEITQPVCLGPDGRVWDGHHRIVAARRLGFTHVPVEP